MLVAGVVIAIDVALAAVIAAYLLYTTEQLFGPLIRGALARIPLIGPTVDRLAIDLLVGIYNNARPWVEASIRPLGDLIGTLHWAIQLPVDRGVGLFYSLGAAAWRIKNLDIPFALQAARSYTDFLVNWALSVALGWAEGAERVARTLFEAANTRTDGLINWALSVALGWVSGLERQTNTLINWALSVALGWVQDAERAARDLVDFEQRRAFDAEQALLRDIDQLGQAVVDRINEAVRGIEGQVQVVERDTVNFVEQVRTQVITRTDTAVVPLAAAITAIETSPCFKACNPLGEIGNLLQGLEDLGLVALIFAMVEEGLRDPEGVTRSVSGELGPLLRDTVTQIAGMAGVRPAA